MGTKRPVRTANDPFAALGLTAGPGLTDDEVRAAWRRVAAATHPDRDDGGDRDRYAAAAAAYSDLRTAFGRGEAYAALAESRLSRRLLAGRPWRLAARAAIAGAAIAVALAAVGPRPAAAGVITGALTWLIITGRHDLASRR